MHKNVDLICVDCKNVLGAINAITVSIANSTILFDHIKLLTSIKIPQKYHHLLYENKIEVIYIDRIKNLNDYNKLSIINLYEYIDSENVMIIQWDGFPINSKCWNAEFLDYDYIGAPWFFESLIYKHKVGNGGFSIRSKRLCEFTAKDKWFVREVSRSNNLLEYGYNFNAEDNLICIINKVLLETSGFCFAPFEIAKKFSAETEPYSKDHYGFHGFHHYKSLPEHIQKMFRS